MVRDDSPTGPPGSRRQPLAIGLVPLGACVVTTAAICGIRALPNRIRGHLINPYIGFLLLVVLPIIFVNELILIPIRT